MATNREPDVSAPVESEYDKLMNHEYDGIREYDNPLPFWWVWLWAASVFFSIGYTAWYHLGKGPSIHDQYEVARARHTEKQLARLGDIAPDDATILRLMKDEEFMASTAGVFRGNCAQCHGTEGGGNIGPNLADDAFINVERPEDIYTVIADGIGTSMPPWKQRMSEPQMILLSAYVASLRGTAPSVAIEPEGSELPPWSEFEVPGEESPPASDQQASSGGGSGSASAG